jgi:membrane protease YdiL (CAAX protease family)
MAGIGSAGTAVSTRAFWWISALTAPPVALAAAALGAGLATDAPLRDIAVLCLASLAEEIVFRGALQPALARALGRRDAVFAWLTTSNVATSVVFAAAHLWRHPPLTALAVFPVSLVFGIARERSGRVWPAAALHVYFNLLLYAASLLFGAWR